VRQNGEATDFEAAEPSRLFSLRPVATSLLMVGILLAGRSVAGKHLPGTAVPEVDYIPDYSVGHDLSCPRREP